MAQLFTSNCAQFLVQHKQKKLYLFTEKFLTEVISNALFKFISVFDSVVIFNMFRSEHRRKNEQQCSGRFEISLSIREFI
jgi:hypothetical protein